MTSQKYSIMADDGEPVGFMVINQPTSFENVMHQPAPLSDGPLADVVLLIASLGSFTGCSMFALHLAHAPLWPGPLIGVVTTALLAGLRTWRAGGPEQTPEVNQDGQPIRVEFWQQNESKPAWLDQFTDSRVTRKDLEAVALAIVDYGQNFSKPALVKSTHISQRKFDLIKDEFLRLGWCEKQENNSHTLNIRGKLFLRHIASTLPH